MYTRKDSGFNPLEKWWFVLRNTITKRTATLTILVLVTLSLPVTIFIAQRQQTVRQFAASLGESCSIGDCNYSENGRYCRWFSGLPDYIWVSPQEANSQYCTYSNRESWCDGGNTKAYCWTVDDNGDGTIDRRLFRDEQQPAIQPTNTPTPAGPQAGFTCNPSQVGCDIVSGLVCRRFDGSNQHIWFPEPTYRTIGSGGSCNVNNRVSGCGTTTWYCHLNDGTGWQTSQAQVTPTPVLAPQCAIAFYKNGTNLNPYTTHVRVGESIEVRLGFGRSLASGETTQFSWGDGTTEQGASSGAEEFHATHTYNTAGTFQVSGTVQRGGSNICAGTQGNYQQPLIVDPVTGTTVTQPPTGGACTQASCSNNPSITYYWRVGNPAAGGFTNASCTQSISNLNSFCAGITQPPGTTITQPPGTTVTQPPGTTVTQPPGTTATQPPGTPVPSGNTHLSFTFRLQGLHNFGIDGEPPQHDAPRHPSRDLRVEIYSTTSPSSQPIFSQLFQNAIIYASTSATLGKATGIVNIGNFTSGNYIVKVKTPRYLKKQIAKTGTQVVTITAGTTNQIAQETLLLGDVNDDGVINSADYSIWLGCYNQPVTGNCINADLNDDGLVINRTNLIDRTWLVRNFNKTDE